MAPGVDELGDESSGMEDILQVFRIFKLARVLKLARHSPGLQAIAYTLQNSYKELGLLIFLICISGFIFASLAYFIEIDQEDTGFTSIPTAFYWVVITMTTIGYGDIFPFTGTDWRLHPNCQYGETAGISHFRVVCRDRPDT